MNNNKDIFKKIFGFNPSIRSTAYSRVNLIGEHTDYTGGYVLPCLLPYKTSISISENKKQNNYTAYSEHFNEKINFNDFIKSKSNHWLDYIKGCLFVTYNESKKLKNTYLNILIESNIPISRGISSSSALSVSILKALNNFFQLSFCSATLAAKRPPKLHRNAGISSALYQSPMMAIRCRIKTVIKKSVSLNLKSVKGQGCHLRLFGTTAG